jgi:DNA mismatch endonuclease, patch repair protein
VDKLDAIRRSENMRQIRSKNTKPEVLLRSRLHKMGYRFRLHRKDLPGKPDIVFPGRRKAIFVHGCFWHQHPGCREGRLPGTRLEYWRPKLQRNQERDSDAIERLHKLGWDTITLWECEVNEQIGAVLNRLQAFLGTSSFASKQQLAGYKPTTNQEI